jgi:hypothetical protein
MKKLTHITAAALLVASASASAWWNDGMSNGNFFGNGDNDTSFNMGFSSKSNIDARGTGESRYQDGYGRRYSNWGPFDFFGNGDNDTSFNMGFSSKTRVDAQSQGRYYSQNGYAPYYAPVAPQAAPAPKAEAPKATES